MPTSDPNILLAALGSNVVEVNIEKRKAGRIVAFVSTDDNAEGTRFNDGKATPQGVFIVGRMNRAWREGQPGKLFAMDLRVPGNSFGLLTILGPTEVSPSALFPVVCSHHKCLLTQPLVSTTMVRTEHIISSILHLIGRCQQAMLTCVPHSMVHDAICNILFSVIIIYSWSCMSAVL